MDGAGLASAVLLAGFWWWGQPGSRGCFPQREWMKAGSLPQIGHWWGKTSHPALFVPGPAFCHGNSKWARSLLPALGTVKANCAEDAGGSSASWRGISRVTLSRQECKSWMGEMQLFWGKKPNLKPICLNPDSLPPFLFASSSLLIY